METIHHKNRHIIVESRSCFSQTLKYRRFINDFISSQSWWQCLSDRLTAEWRTSADDTPCDPVLPRVLPAGSSPPDGALRSTAQIWVSSVVSRRAENGVFQCIAVPHKPSRRRVLRSRLTGVSQSNVKPAFTIIKQRVDIFLTPSWMFDRRLKIKASSQKHYPQISVSTPPHLSPRNRPFHMP